MKLSWMERPVDEDDVRDIVVRHSNDMIKIDERLRNLVDVFVTQNDDYDGIFHAWLLPKVFFCLKQRMAWALTLRYFNLTL